MHAEGHQDVRHDDVHDQERHEQQEPDQKGLGELRDDESWREHHQVVPRGLFFFVALRPAREVLEEVHVVGRGVAT